jgi:DNA repair photolyase
VTGVQTCALPISEEKLGITREILEVLDELGHPVGIITKSARILRDRDILQRMARRDLVHVHISITSLSPELASRMEPRASSPGRRLAAVRGLTEAGIPVSVLCSPMIPALNDCELEAILEASAAAGAISAGYILLRLPMEVADLFSDWLAHHYPQRKAHVLDLLRSTHGGALYRADFGDRMAGTGPYAKLLRQRFTLAVRRCGLDRKSVPLTFEHFKPARARRAQLALF